MGRVAGIDFGLKRIGIAISDETKTIAMPLETVIAEKHLNLTVGKLLKRLEEYELETFVVGMPYLMSGKVGHLADEVASFIKMLETYTKIPIITLDERLTSVQADRSLREGGMSRKKRAARVDVVAAVLLLQCYLDRLSFEKF